MSSWIFIFLSVTTLTVLIVGDVKIPLVILAKLVSMFKTLDANNDGILEIDDYYLVAERYSEAAKLDANKAKHLKEVLVPGQWTILIQLVGGTGERFTQQQYVELLYKSLTSNILKTMKDNPYVEFHQFVDVNSDGSLDESEYLAMLKAFNVDSDAAKDCFHKLDTDGDGKISDADFGKHIRAFYTSLEPNSPSQCLLGPIQA